MTEPLRALEGRDQSDRAIFEVEKAGRPARTWHMACHATDLAKPGDYHSFKIAVESLFSLRDREGVIRTFHHIGPHRAHRRVEGQRRTDGHPSSRAQGPS